MNYLHSVKEGHWFLLQIVMYLFKHMLGQPKEKRNYIIQVSANGTYTVDVTSWTGCVTTESYIVSGLILEL
ncbi:MAG: hypothetical protein R2728_03085 [Chitinophagales bacterium]